MRTSTRRIPLVAALSAVLVVPTAWAAAGQSKEAMIAEMLVLGEQMRALKPRIAIDSQAAADFASADARYRSLSTALGGDDPAATLGDGAVDGRGPLGGVPVPPGCTPGATGVGSNNTPLPIPDSGGATVSNTIAIAGAGPYLWHVALDMNLTHTFPGDVDMTLTSPAGTVVTISSDNAGSNDNVWAGTTFDDYANPGGQVPYSTNDGLVNDHPYAVGVVAPLLAPEEAFAAFIGEDPNGTWTITLDDDAGGDTGTLNSWSLTLATLAAAPEFAVAIGASNNTPLPIPDSGGATVSNTANLAGADTYLCGLTLTVDLTHTFPGDLDLTLMSPSGAIATFSSDNGGSNDNVWVGTTFDDDVNPGGQVPYTTNAGLVNDHPYAVGVPATPLVPEEAFGSFTGLDPNGTWTVTADDDAGGDTGTLNSWSIQAVTCSCPVLCTIGITCPSNQQAFAPPGAPSTPVTYPDPLVSGDCASVTTVCVPASGEEFPVGTTTVVCTAIDATGPSATCSFDVTVEPTATVLEIPTLSRTGFAVFGLLLLAAGALALRRRA